MKDSFMFRRTALFGLCSAALLLTACAQTARNEAPTRQKLVIQVSDADTSKWNLALNNAKNVQDELGAANVDIEIVAFGPGINMVKFDSVVNTRLDDAAKAGVKVLACENSMRNFKLTKSDVEPSVGYVPAGVVHIMRRQREGWSYLRP
jgi:uncharacterized protein